MQLISYGRRSRSARLLSQSLPRDRDHILINWGCSNANCGNYHVINKPEAVRNAVSKGAALQILKRTGISVPEYTPYDTDALAWLENNYSVYARTLTRSHGGKGIVLHHPGDTTITRAPLYTKSISCKREYRVHIFNGEVIDLVAKCKRNGDIETGDYIRNHSMGYVFVRHGITIPDSVRSQLSSLAISAVSALGLDFGAVDIIRSMDNQLYVLEINTAPGLTGTTLQRYLNAISNLT